MSQKTDIEDLQRKVKELEKRVEDVEKKPPVFVPVPYPVMSLIQPLFPQPYIVPQVPRWEYQPSYTNDWQQKLSTNTGN